MTNSSLSFKQREVIEGPLAGVKIIDFSRLLPGPIATMFLAQQGAEVIKIEAPNAPDYIRYFEPKVADQSAFYLSLNANKKSFAIDFLNEEGKKYLLQLVATADVLVEQFRPDVMKKFGLDYEFLKTIQPNLIYISITGYGANSSLKTAAGHDLNYIAESGLAFLNGSSPTLPGFQAADIAGGAYMAMNAITTALYQREKTGRGQHIQVAMADSTLPMMALPLALQQFKDEVIRLQNFELGGYLANYSIYCCADEKHIALAALEPKFWNNFCTAINKPEWEVRAFGNHQEVQSLKQDLTQLFLSKTQGEWLSILKNADCCISAINNIKEVLASPYFNGQKMFIEVEAEGNKNIKILRHPLQFYNSDFDKFWTAPNLGEDTATILSTLGLGEKEIEKLVLQGIVSSFAE